MEYVTGWAWERIVSTQFIPSIGDNGISTKIIEWNGHHSCTSQSTSKLCNETPHCNSCWRYSVLLLATFPVTIECHDSIGDILIDRRIQTLKPSSQWAASVSRLRLCGFNAPAKPETNKLFAANRCRGKCAPPIKATLFIIGSIIHNWRATRLRITTAAQHGM